MKKKIIWHINHSNKDATNKIVQITVKNLTELSYDSKIITPFSSVFKGSLYGMVIQKTLKVKIILSKILRKILTHNDYYFYNIIDFVSIFPCNYLSKKLGKPDLIIIYWVSGFLTAKDINKLHKKFNCKFIWYPADMGPLTGGCHYTWGCTKYENNCFKCPAFKNNTFDFIAAFNLKRRLNYLSNINFHIISGSNEMDKQIKRSISWKNSDVTKIYATIDEKIYRPIANRNVIKEKYGLSLNKIILLAGANNLGFVRKGFSYLIETLIVLIDKYPNLKDKIELMLIGTNIEKIIPLIPVKVINGGYIRNEETLVEIYNVADLLISPSIEDSGPMMINQALMCGTPVVAFNVGVAIDFINNIDTGYIVDVKDVNSMSDKIITFMQKSEQERDSMRRQCRLLAIESFSNNIMIQALKNIKI